jgi:hypothetical protein
MSFIETINSEKNILEARHKRAFIKLYTRIGNDLINLAQRGRPINFAQVFQNYKADYIYLFRSIYADVNLSFGFGIRKDLNFSAKNKFEIKSVQISVSSTDQQTINHIYDDKYTPLLNNQTEELANNDFINSEAQYFENIYNNSVKDQATFVEKQNDDANKIGVEILALLLLLRNSTITKVQKEQLRRLQKRKEAIEKKLDDIAKNKIVSISKTFKTKLEEKMDIRAEGNAVYGVNKGTSEIRELEYQSIKESGVSVEKPTVKPTLIVTPTKIALISLITKVWRHRSIRNPRVVHVALDGGQPDSSGFFFVNGYIASVPRDKRLPASESVNCRCEIEYVVG